MDYIEEIHNNIENNEDITIFNKKQITKYEFTEIVYKYYLKKINIDYLNEDAIVKTMDDLYIMTIDNFNSFIRVYKKDENYYGLMVKKIAYEQYITDNDFNKAIKITDKKFNKLIKNIIKIVETYYY